MMAAESMRPQIRLRGLTFDQLETFLLNGKELVIVTGANNSGKSAFLKDIYACLSNNSFLTGKKSVKWVRIEKDFDADYLIEYMEKRHPYAFRPNDALSLFGSSTHRGILEHIGNHGMDFQFLVQIFAFLAETRSRLTEVSPPLMFDRTSEEPEYPIQRLFADVDLEHKISNRFESAFGVGLVVHRGAGSKIPLYVGRPPDWTKENDRTSVEYLQKIEALPKLEDQGDGMKAFAAILLRIMTFDRSLLLIDEPELLLHPPQARLIGRIIAEEQSAGKQMFVATHSSDVLQGLIEARSTNLKIVRLSKNEKYGRHWLTQNAAEKFVTDTLLRSSNVLDGLFHREVALCEGDRDIVFYRECLNAITTKYSDRDILFVNTNGKDRMPEFVEALSDLGIDPIIIADIDLIRSYQTLEKLLRAKKRNSGDIMHKSKRIVAEIEQKNFPISAGALRANILDKFKDSDDNKPPSKQTVAAIRGLLTDISSFAIVKKAGVRGLPSGDCQRLYKEIDEELQAAKIWLVPEGELEGFFRTGSGKGKGWISDVLSFDLASDPALEEARKFVGAVFEIR